MNAWATDIQCDTTKQPAQRVICDYAILNHEYDGIFDQQQKLAQEGRLTPADIAAWRQKRDTCSDVHCIDGVFAAWDSQAKGLENRAAAPAAVITASQALGPASAVTAASLPASDASQQASGVPVSRQGSAYGVALPQSVASGSPDASAPAPASAESASAESSAGWAMPSLLPLVVGILLILVVTGGAMWIYRNRRRT